MKPGEAVSIDVVVKRPGWVGWLAGSEDTVHLTVRAPQARVKDRWLTVAKSSKPTVTFDEPVHAVAYGNPGELSRHRFASPRRSLQVGSEQVAGTIVVRAARPAMGATRQAAERHLVPGIGLDRARRQPRRRLGNLALGAAAHHLLEAGLQGPRHGEAEALA